MHQRPVLSILSKWPDRRSVLDDVRLEDPQIEMVAVHRWFQRGSVPARYWAALVFGAQARGVSLEALEILLAHSDSDVVRECWLDGRQSSSGSEAA